MISIATQIHCCQTTIRIICKLILKSNKKWTDRAACPQFAFILQECNQKISLVSYFGMILSAHIFKSNAFFNCKMSTTAAMREYHVMAMGIHFYLFYAGWCKDRAGLLYTPPRNPINSLFVRECVIRNR